MQFYLLFLNKRNNILPLLIWLSGVDQGKVDACLNYANQINNLHYIVNQMLIYLIILSVPTPSIPY